MSGKCNLLLSILYYLLPLFSMEDSTPLLCSFAFGSVRMRSKGSRIKPMRRIKPPSCPPLGMKGLALATWGSSWQSVTKEKPLQGGVGEDFLHLFNIYSQLFGCYSQKIIFCEWSSIVPPCMVYMLNIQCIRCGGIMVELRVELHVIPP